MAKPTVSHLDSMMNPPAGTGTVLRRDSGGSGGSGGSGLFGLSSQQARGLAAGAVLGAGIGQAVGGFITASSQKKMFGFNAKVLRMQARDAIERGREAEARFRVGVRGLIGSQRARLASLGFDPNEGTALDIQVDTARIGELDALQIRNNAAMEAWGFRAAARAERFKGDLAEQQAIVSGVGSILGGAVGAGSILLG